MYCAVCSKTIYYPLNYSLIGTNWCFPCWLKITHNNPMGILQGFYRKILHWCLVPRIKKRVNILLIKRHTAQKLGNYGVADYIRCQLREMGIDVTDQKDGSVYCKLRK